MHRCSSILARLHPLSLSHCKPRQLRGLASVPCTKSRAHNRAIVFIKPSANTAASRALVEAKLSQSRIEVVSSSSISAEAIDAQGIIDRHYYAIASKATLGTADTLPVDAVAFTAFFKTDYEEAKSSGKVLNAMQACEYLQCEGHALESLWEAAAARGLRCKLGGGFYCARLDADLTGAASTCWVFNGFFMKMRAEYTKPTSSVHLYSVCWDPRENNLPWSKFRSDVIGATIPAEAAAASIRGAMLANWKELGLPREPYAGDNGVHASAGPFEGLAERVNWLGATVPTDAFGSELLSVDGVDDVLVASWMLDPQVCLGSVGVAGSLFDALEDLDTEACLEKCGVLSKLRMGKL